MATVSRSSETALRLALERTNVKYRGNVEFNRTGSNYYQGEIRAAGGSVLRFSLNVADSRGPGHRMTPGMYGAKSRRLRAACWHVWRDFLTELFEIDPKATVRTALATYKGREGFEAEFPATYYRNAGSMAEPHDYGTLCECKS